MRRMIVFVGLLVACGGNGPKKRVLGGERASVPSLIKVLEAVREAESPGPLLAQGVFEQCGKACACLDFGEGGDAEARIAMCRDVWKDQAPAGSGIDWRALSVVGAYLADQHAAADARDKKLLEDAMAALTVPIVPTAAGLGVAPATATHIAGYGVGRHVVTIDAQGAVRGGTGPIARFTPSGALLVPAELKPLADPAAVAAFVRGVNPPAAAPPEEKETSGADQALEEGKMGKPDRREGQYRMQAPSDGLSADAVSGAKHSATGIDGRVTSRALTIVADRGAPGAKLVEVMAQAEQSVIAIARGDELGGLMLVFRGAQGGGPRSGDGGGDVGGDPGGDPGVARVVPAELVVEVADASSFHVGNSVMRDHVRVDGADPAALGKAIEEKMKDAAFADRRDVVVSVRDEARAAQVVAAVDAAIAAGARPVRVESWYERPAGLGVSGLGDPGGTPSGRTPGTVPDVSIGAPAATGTLDKEVIRKHIKRAIPKITHCYEKVLVDKPGIGGTVSTQFFISPAGTVATSSATGVDPAVASCVADVIKTIKFPKPTGGGGVQVNYPFTFRAAE